MFLGVMFLSLHSLAKDEFYTFDPIKEKWDIGVFVAIMLLLSSIVILLQLAMQDGRTKYLSDVLHVSNITKELGLSWSNG